MAAASSKASAEACANQGLIKYWGKTADPALRIPTNNSISVCVDALRTHTTVEFSADRPHDEFVVDGSTAGDQRVFRHLDLLRGLARSTWKARVVSHNRFPAASGLASSASGFAALTVAATEALGLRFSVEELSRLARRGSGSASRSVPGGFAELLAGSDDRTTYATQLAAETQLDFRTVVAIVAASPKKVGSSEGMRITAETSPFFATRLQYLPAALARMRNAIAARDGAAVAQVAETDTLNMHACMLTSTPALLYWTSGTMDVMRCVHGLREEGKPVFFSIDGGQNVFVNTTAAHVAEVERKLRALGSVAETMTSRPGGPARVVPEHLF